MATGKCYNVLFSVSKDDVILKGMTGCRAYIDGGNITDAEDIISARLTEEGVDFDAIKVLVISSLNKDRTFIIEVT